MNNFVLHLGFPRTATTWLQANLTQHPDILYLGRFNNGLRDENRWLSSEVYSFWRHLKNDKVLVKEDKSLLYEQIRELAGDVRQTKVRTIAFSEETLAKPWLDYPNWRVNGKAFI